MAGGALRLPLIFAAATVAAGVLDSFLPLAKGIPSNLASAALLVQAITATISRWQAGKHGDRYGHARLLIPALAVAAIGMSLVIISGHIDVSVGSLIGVRLTCGKERFEVVTLSDQHRPHSGSRTGNVRALARKIPHAGRSLDREQILLAYEARLP